MKADGQHLDRPHPKHSHMTSCKLFLHVQWEHSVCPSLSCSRSPELSSLVWERWAVCCRVPPKAQTLTCTSTCLRAPLDTDATGNLLSPPSYPRYYVMKSRFREAPVTNHWTSPSQLNWDYPRRVKSAGVWVNGRASRIQAHISSLGQERHLLGTLLMARRGRSTRTVRMAERLTLCPSREYSIMLGEQACSGREEPRGLHLLSLSPTAPWGPSTCAPCQT